MGILDKLLINSCFLINRVKNKGQTLRRLINKIKVKIDTDFFL